MRSILAAGSIAGIAHLIQVMQANPEGTKDFLLLLAFILVGLTAWRGPQPPPRPPGRRKP